MNFWLGFFPFAAHANFASQSTNDQTQVIKIQKIILHHPKNKFQFLSKMTKKSQSYRFTFSQGTHEEILNYLIFIGSGSTFGFLRLMVFSLFYKVMVITNKRERDPIQSRKRYRLMLRLILREQHQHISESKVIKIWNVYNNHKPQ